MSFVHLDKSIVTFHFKEILEDSPLGAPLALVGLGALLLSPVLTRKVQTAALPHRPGISLTAWVQQQQAATAPHSRTPLSLTSPDRSSDRWAA
jgi:hypothetical protein